MENFYQRLKIKIDLDSFWRLPPNFMCYKREYFDGEAEFIPRLKSIDLALDLATAPLDSEIRIRDSVVKDEIRIRDVSDADWPQLAQVMSSSFSNTLPFCSLDEEASTEAANKCLIRTREGEDGEFLVSLVAECSSNILGAAIVTRYESQPFLTWIFVKRWSQRTGVGSLLLKNIVDRLVTDWTVLRSCMFLDNTQSLLWHWKMGFRIENIHG